MKDFTRALFVTLQVVHALMMRETRSRYGRHRLGYLWALVGPLGFIGVFAAMYYFVGRSAPHGMGMVQFLATGFCTFLLFRTVNGQAASAINANRGLLYYPQVRPLDLVAARVILEGVAMALVFGIIAGGAGLLGEKVAVDSMLLVMIGFIHSVLLGATLGLTLCGLAVFYPFVTQVRRLMNRPLLFISGCFFAGNDLPPSVSDAFFMNPILHAVELVRSGWFTCYESHHASVTYPLLWIVPMAVIGMTLERVARRQAHLA